MRKGKGELTYKQSFDENKRLRKEKDKLRNELHSRTVAYNKLLKRERTNNDEMQNCPFCGKPVNDTNIQERNGKFYLTHTCFTDSYGWGAAAISKIEFWAHTKNELVRLWNGRI